MANGVTTEGYVLKTQAEINSEAEIDLQKVEDPVSQEKLQVDFESSDIVAQIVSVTLEGVGDGLLVDEAAYGQYDPTGATGDALSSLVVVNGISRRGLSNSTVVLDFTGTPSAAVNQLITVTDTLSQNEWITTAFFVLDGAGSANVPATCQTAGDIEANANTLTILVTTTEPNLSAVNNGIAATAGNNEETDTDLRRRRDLSTEAPSVGLPTSVFSAISNIENVDFVRVYNNITNAADANGIPAKTMAVAVVGGDDQTIAQTILSRRGDAAATAGNTTVSFQDEQGFTYPINFYRPVLIQIYVDVTVTITETDVFPADGDVQIQDAIVDYSKGGAAALGVTDGFDDNGFPPGSDVIYTRLYTPINFVPGHEVDSLFIGFAPAPAGTTNLTINFNEVANFVVVNVNVTVN